MKKSELKLKKIRIEVKSVGRHIFADIAKIFNKKATGNVVSLRIIGIYEKGIEEKTDLNLLTGDNVELTIKKGTKNIMMPLGMNLKKFFKRKKYDH